jgi:hypothetical protein
LQAALTTRSAVPFRFWFALKPLGLTANALAEAIRVPSNRITAILKDEKRHHR